MELSETAQKLVEEFGEAVIDFSREPNRDNLYKLAAKRQALEKHLHDLEVMGEEKGQVK